MEWFAARKVVGTYLLRLKPSINYVWIFRVFLIVMLLTPPLLRLERAVRDDRGFIALLAALFGLQALLTVWLKPLHLGFLVDDWLLYAVGYSIPFLAGVRMRYADRRRSLWFCGIFLRRRSWRIRRERGCGCSPTNIPRGSISCCGERP